MCIFNNGDRVNQFSLREKSKLVLMLSCDFKLVLDPNFKNSQKVNPNFSYHFQFNFVIFNFDN